VHCSVVHTSVLLTSLSDLQDNFALISAKLQSSMTPLSENYSTFMVHPIFTVTVTIKCKSSG